MSILKNNKDVHFFSTLVGDVLDACLYLCSPLDKLWCQSHHGSNVAGVAGIGLAFHQLVEEHQLFSIL